MSNEILQGASGAADRLGTILLERQAENRQNARQDQLMERQFAQQRLLQQLQGTQALEQTRLQGEQATAQINLRDQLTGRQAQQQRDFEAGESAANREFRAEQSELDRGQRQQEQRFGALQRVAELSIQQGGQRRLAREAGERELGQMERAAELQRETNQIMEGIRAEREMQMEEFRARVRRGEMRFASDIEMQNAAERMVLESQLRTEEGLRGTLLTAFLTAEGVMGPDGPLPMLGGEEGEYVAAYQRAVQRADQLIEGTRSEELREVIERGKPGGFAGVFNSLRTFIDGREQAAEPATPVEREDQPQRTLSAQTPARQAITPAVMLLPNGMNRASVAMAEAGMDLSSSPIAEFASTITSQLYAPSEKAAVFFQQFNGNSADLVWNPLNGKPTRLPDRTTLLRVYEGLRGKNDPRSDTDTANRVAWAALRDMATNPSKSFDAVKKYRDRLGLRPESSQRDLWKAYAWYLKDQLITTVNEEVMTLSGQQ